MIFIEYILHELLLKNCDFKLEDLSAISLAVKIYKGGEMKYSECGEIIENYENNKKEINARLKRVMERKLTSKEIEYFSEEKKAKIEIIEKERSRLKRELSILDKKIEQIKSIRSNSIGKGNIIFKSKKHSYDSDIESLQNHREMLKKQICEKNNKINIINQDIKEKLDAIQYGVNVNSEDYERLTKEMDNLKKSYEEARDIIDGTFALLDSRKEADKKQIYEIIKRVLREDGFRVEEKVVTKRIEREDNETTEKVKKSFVVVNDEAGCEREFASNKIGSTLMKEMYDYIPSETYLRIIDEISICYRNHIVENNKKINRTRN